ncbi:MAG: hypothetical protein KGY76_05535 [Candidatus Thermoplasmatota archaeon]|nr:hypothetical protein [Candidatus Thermoplasmatota archaeon]
MFDKGGRKFFPMMLSFLLIISASVIAITPRTAEGNSEIINDVSVDINTSDHPKITLNKDDERLYSIEYQRIELVRREKDDILLPLNETNWHTEIEKVEQEKISHLKVDMNTTLQDMDSEEEMEGDLSLNFKIISQEDVSEIIFSFKLDNISGLPSGRLLMIQNLEFYRDIKRPPERRSGNAHVEYFELAFSDGHTGHYSWSGTGLVDDQKKDSIAKTTEKYESSQSLFIGLDYDSSAESIALIPLDVDDSRTSAKTDIPGPFDRFPFFVATVLLGGFAVLGTLYHTRKKFYEEREPGETVRLEKSTYFKGYDEEE